MKQKVFDYENDYKEMEDQITQQSSMIKKLEEKIQEMTSVENGKYNNKSMMIQNDIDFKGDQQANLPKQSCHRDPRVRKKEIEQPFNSSSPQDIIDNTITNNSNHHQNHARISNSSSSCQSCFELKQKFKELEEKYKSKSISLSEHMKINRDLQNQLHQSKFKNNDQEIRQQQNCRKCGEYKKRLWQNEDKHKRIQNDLMDKLKRKKAENEYLCSKMAKPEIMKVLSTVPPPGTTRRFT